MAKYTEPELRERLKAQIRDSDKGGRKGQWSARKSQLLTQEYKRQGGGFIGPKDERQRSLQRWGDQDWRTEDGSTRARQGGETRRYLPGRAWEQLSDQERAATESKKRRASRTGRQFVPNTGPAQRARKNVTAPNRLSDLPVAEAGKVVRGLDTRELRAALQRERRGKARKTLLQRMEAELRRR
ncbi:hypothetical protein GA0070622_2863 [Micromonospora sediminicola]|uniref:DUF5872 domain-containing protein n=1 Tax=Micromonospora sediminicola TaxID=946078 RepID=A0A1A9BA45_9ACTN|nr:hypothetical protein [Micromonospora sediminicola]SBT65849.1 hypothetical protein GA0070622_2863 [Micromonospora sediminicola]